MTSPDTPRARDSGAHLDVAASPRLEDAHERAGWEKKKRNSNSRRRHRTYRRHRERHPGGVVPTRSDASTSRRQGARRESVETRRRKLQNPNLTVCTYEKYVHVFYSKNVQIILITVILYLSMDKGVFFVFSVRVVVSSAKCLLDGWSTLHSSSRTANARNPGYEAKRKPKRRFFLSVGLSWSSLVEESGNNQIKSKSEVNRVNRIESNHVDG